VFGAAIVSGARECDDYEMFRLAVILSLFFAVPAKAEEKKLSGAEIRSALADKIVLGTDEGGHGYTQVFQKGGVTLYTVNQSSTSTGLWDVRQDQYCSQWPPGQIWTCYDVTSDGTSLTFVARDGKTWPVTLAK
jgi:hypothetical protein